MKCKDLMKFLTLNSVAEREIQTKIFCGLSWRERYLISRKEREKEAVSSMYNDRKLNNYSLST
jgi:hypothetical protein